MFLLDLPLLPPVTTEILDMMIASVGLTTQNATITSTSEMMEEAKRRYLMELCSSSSAAARSRVALLSTAGLRDNKSCSHCCEGCGPFFRVWEFHNVELAFLQHMGFPRYPLIIFARRNFVLHPFDTQHVVSRAGCSGRRSQLPSNRWHTPVCPGAPS